jgi:hypothetical protein
MRFLTCPQSMSLKLEPDEPARIAASRLITPERRRECFEQTVKRQHRCFCCLALLTFTMDEEFRQRCCCGMGGGQERDRLPH